MPLHRSLGPPHQFLEPLRAARKFILRTLVEAIGWFRARRAVRGRRQRRPLGPCPCHLRRQTTHIDLRIVNLGGQLIANAGSSRQRLGPLLPVPLCGAPRGVQPGQMCPDLRDRLAPACAQRGVGVSISLRPGCIVRRCRGIRVLEQRLDRVPLMCGVIQPSTHQIPVVGAGQGLDVLAQPFPLPSGIFERRVSRLGVERGDRRLRTAGHRLDPGAHRHRLERAAGRFATRQQALERRQRDIPVVALDRHGEQFRLIGDAGERRCANRRMFRTPRHRADRLLCVNPAERGEADRLDPGSARHVTEVTRL